MMKSHIALRVIGFGLLFGSILYCWLWLLPPAPWIDYALNPAYFALSVTSVVAPIYVVLAMRADRREHLERLLLASFLAGMPVIYLWGALRNHDAGGALLESVGVLVFGAWAVVGYQRSSMFIGMGIAAHGIGWDAWHHGHVSYIEPHYPIGCFIIDIAFGLAIAGAVFGRSVVTQQSVRGDESSSRVHASNQA